MTLAVSSSSAYAVVALLLPNRNVVQERSVLSERNASGAICDLLQMLQDDGHWDWSRIDTLLVDWGPGSFSGVKVAVTMAKSWAVAQPVPIYATFSHDLYATEACVAIEHKSGSYYVRRPGSDPVNEDSMPLDASIVVAAKATDISPSFSNAILANWHGPYDAVNFVPSYLVEPSISLPKTPYPSKAES